MGDGALKVQSAVNTYFNIFYQGMNFAGADACIDIVSPPAPSKTVTQAGMGLWTGRGWNFIYITSDGSAGVTGLQDNSWVNPVPLRKFDGVKTGANAVNQLRLVWTAPPHRMRRRRRIPMCRYSSTTSYSSNTKRFRTRIGRSRFTPTRRALNTSSRTSPSRNRRWLKNRRSFASARTRGAKRGRICERAAG